MAKKIFGDKLGAILESSALSFATTINHSSVHRELQYLLAKEIIPGTYQPRRDFDQESLQELANSIKEKGILQPLIVRRAGQEYELIAGERRWRAAQLAGLNQIPVIVCDIDNNAALAFSLIENIQRQNLNVIEEAMALKRLLDEFSMTHEEVAKSIGKSRVLVSNTLRLLNLSDPVKEMLINRQLEMGHARAILSLDTNEQVEIAGIVIEKQMTVRSTEALVNSIRNNKSKVKTAKEIINGKPKLLSLEKIFQELFGLMTKISVDGKGQGRVVMHFSDIIQIEKIVRKFSN